MPIYEYACPRCARSFEEVVVRRSDEAEVKCPSCGATDVTRQMSRPGSVGGGASASSAPRPPRACGPVG